MEYALSLTQRSAKNMTAGLQKYPRPYPEASFAILVSFLVLFCNSSASSAILTKIRSISVHGNHLFTERQILDGFNSKIENPFSLPAIRRDVSTLASTYRDEGYYFVNVRLADPVFTPDSASVDLQLTISEGGKGEVGEIHLEGNTLFTSDQILQAFSTRPGEVFRKDVLEQDIDALISRYEKSGCPFAEVSVDRIDPAGISADSSTVSLNISITINEGSKVKIAVVQVIGNTETSEHVIIREAGIVPGELYDSDKMERVRNRLNRMNIFSQVDEPALYVDDNGDGRIVLKVKEGNTSTFDGIVGYVPGNTSTTTTPAQGAPAVSDQGYLTGLVNVSLRNLFGTDRKMSVRWERDDRFSQELAAQYVEPWIFDLPIDLSGSFSQRQQDTTFVRRDVEGKADVHLSDAVSIAGSIMHENVIPSNSLAVALLTNSSTTSFGLELRYDSRDDIISPLSGVYYSTDYEIGTKKYPAPPPSTSQLSSAVSRAGLDADFFVPAFTRQVIALGVHGRELTSGDIELGDLYRFGGATTLRGYAENQFLGSKIGWTNLEYRFILARRTFFFGFFDAGYYFLPANYVLNAPGAQQYRYGYGVGLRFDSSLGNIGVSLALGEGDSFTQAKIHIGLLNEF